VQILRAAEAVFARNGFGGATMSAIAEAAALPKANLHYYFGSKELLYRAVLEDILSTWLADADVWIVPGRTPHEGLGGYIRAKMAWTQSRSDASRLFAGEMLTGAPHIRHFLGFELRAHVERMARVFAHWVEQGLMQPVPAEHLLFCIWAMTQSYADFAPQMEAVLGRAHGLRPDDYAAACDMILRLVLQSCAIGENGIA
jgi:TetR/AcrR family transcriptional regulator